MAEIESDPERFPVVHGRLRRMLLQRFPYAVYFEVYAPSHSVVGVIHGHRLPDIWLKRAAP
jgi:toxin ParE1/3/4